MPRPAAPVADPLADLRAPEHREPEAPAGEVVPEAEQVTLHSPAWHDQALAQIVGAWHRDKAAQGFAHKGGTCGCRYLARLAMEAVHGQPVEPLEDEPDEGSADG